MLSWGFRGAKMAARTVNPKALHVRDPAHIKCVANIHAPDA